MASLFKRTAARCLQNGCPTSPELRKRFGCDGDADPGYSVPCWACRGEHAATCPTCVDGEVFMTDCPKRLVGAHELMAHRAYGHYKAGFLPEAGGLADQSAPFVSAVEILDSLYGFHHEREMKRG